MHWSEPVPSDHHSMCRSDRFDTRSTSVVMLHLAVFAMLAAVTSAKPIPVPCASGHVSCPFTFGTNSSGCCPLDDAESVCCQTPLPVGLKRSYCCPKGSGCSTNVTTRAISTATQLPGVFLRDFLCPGLHPYAQQLPLRPITGLELQVYFNTKMKILQWKMMVLVLKNDDL